MLNETYMKVTPSGGVPADRYSGEQWEKLPIGETIRVSWSRPRNVAFHRMFFAALSFLFKHQDLYSVQDDLRDDISIALGHCEKGVYRGKSAMRAKSISFAKMNEDSFREYFEGFVKMASERIAPHLSAKDFDVFYEILDGNQGKQGKRITDSRPNVPLGGWRGCDAPAAIKGERIV